MKNILLTAAGALLCFLTFGQEVISSSGESFSAGNAQVDFTFGEPLTATYPSQDATLTEGFHQTNLQVSELGEDLFTDVSIRVYPNPVADIVTISQEENTEDLQIKLIDPNGKIISHSSFDKPEKKYDLSNLRAGNYFIEILNLENHTIKNFKIIKLH